MSLENVEITSQMAEAFNAGGTDAARRYYRPEIEWHEDPSFPEAGTYRGLENVVAYQEQFLSEFEDIHYEVGETTAAGDHVVANVLIAGSGKASGAGFEISAWWALTFRNGQVIRIHSYLDKDAALQAVGLAE